MFKEKSPEKLMNKLKNKFPVFTPIFAKGIDLTNFHNIAKEDELFFASIVFQAIMCTTKESFNILCDYLPQERVNKMDDKGENFEVCIYESSLFVSSHKKNDLCNDVFLFLENDIELKIFETFLDSIFIPENEHSWSYSYIMIKWIGNSLILNEYGIHKEVNEDLYLMIYNNLSIE